MNNGWIKIYRKLREWEWYTDSQMVHLFIHLLLEANHEDRQWRGTTIKRGQLLTSRSKLSIETGISERSIRTCLERLKSTSQLTSQSTSRNTILTICNYDDYQVMENESDQQNDQPAVRQTTSKRPTITQELKNNSIVVSKDTMSKSCQTSTQDVAESIDFEKLINFFNKTTKGVFKGIRKPITENRKGLIRARVREHGKEAFVEMVKKSIESDFLKGENNRGWVATFDWMIKPNNFAKILEGNYDNRNNNGRQQQKGTSAITDDQLLEEIRQGWQRGIAENEVR